MDEIYKENSHRPFINGKKGELEMLIMYVWLFDDVKDTEYWSEYVNLCISTGRVNIVKNVNVLIPVKNRDILYPSDIKSTQVFIETFDGSIGSNPDSKYILRLNYNKDNDSMWRDEQELRSVIENLEDTFEKYGVPHALELLSPLRSQTYNEDEFFKQYRLLERSMKKYTSMKISLINGPIRHTTKPKYLMQTTEDIVRIRQIVKELKFNLKFAIDFSKLMKKRNSRGQFEDDFNKLSAIRTSIVGIHLADILGGSSYSKINYQDDKVYLDKFNYHQNSDLLNYISALLNDNRSRYLVPEDINSTNALEELSDDLLRGGFSFCNQEGKQ